MNKSFEIHHEVGINGKPQQIYKALTNIDMLSKWWTSDTRGSEKVGGILEFWFNDHLKSFKIVKLDKNKLVEWKVMDGDGKNWGTGKISFNLSVASGKTIVKFKHSGWKSKTGDLAHCSTKWGVFMLSLKDLVEKSQGQPFPHDVQVS